MNPHQQKLLKIQEKIFQVLRIKKQLESRRQYYIKQLSSSSNTKEALGYLSSLAEIYKREERVIGICEKGLLNALEILAEVEGIVNSIESFPLRAWSWGKSKIPIIGKKDTSPQSLIPLLKLMYSYLRGQIVYIDENLHIIKANLSNQYKYVLELILETKEGKVFGDISQTKYFREIEQLRQEEAAIIHKIEEESKAVKGKIVRVVTQINIRMSRNKRLLKLQVLFQISPIVAVGTSATGIFLGPQYIPLAFLLLNFVNFSPTIAIFAKESAILLKKPTKRMKALAILRLKATKLGLTSQAARIRETMVELTQLPRRPAYAYAR